MCVFAGGTPVKKLHPCPDLLLENHWVFLLQLASLPMKTTNVSQKNILNTETKRKGSEIAERLGEKESLQRLPWTEFRNRTKRLRARERERERTKKDYASSRREQRQAQTETERD